MRFRLGFFALLALSVCSVSRPAPLAPAAGATCKADAGWNDLWSRIGPRTSAPLLDPDACKRYAATAGIDLDARIARERASPMP